MQGDGTGTLSSYDPGAGAGTADDAFLVSHAASFVSGVALHVDGGMLVSLNDGGPA